LPKAEPRSTSRTQKGERGIWQRRFWEHAIRDPADWPYSSFHRYVKLGMYPPDWGTAAGDDADGYGE
jgi:putative transposase